MWKYEEETGRQSLQNFTNHLLVGEYYFCIGRDKKAGIIWQTPSWKQCHRFENRLKSCVPYTLFCFHTRLHMVYVNVYNTMECVSRY